MKRMSDEVLLKTISIAWKEYHGDATVLASAIGALVLGRDIGWQALRLMYARATFAKYEKMLGVKFRQVLPARGPDAERLRGIRLADSIGKFWQAVAGGLVPAREAAQTA